MNNLVPISQNIPQTSKTILFDVFNTNTSKDITNLAAELEIVKNAKNRSDKFQDITEKLEVGSFEEFVKKFSPTVYMNSETSVVTGEPEFMYSMDQKPNSIPVPIVGSNLYEIIQEISKMKKNSSVSDKELSARIREIMEKQFSTENQRQKQQDIRAVVTKQYEMACKMLEDGREEEADEYFDICDQKIEETIKTLKNPVAFLPMRIADIRATLDYKIESEKKQCIGMTTDDGTEVTIEGAEDSKPIIGLPYWNEQGELDIKPLDEIEDSGDSNENSEKFLLEVRESWENAAKSLPAINQSSSMVSLVVDSYTKDGSMQLMELSKSELAQKYEASVAMYEKCQQSFFDVVGELIQKVMNVETFFQHATDGGSDLKKNAKLIIANCTIDKLDTENADGIFSQYLDDCQSSTESRIWFAILPPIDDPELGGASNSRNERKFIKRPERRGGTKQKFSTVTRFETAKSMIGILSKHKIISFFNFRACTETSFSGLTTDIIEKYKARVTEIDKEASEYAVLAYPNFTAISEYDRNFILNKAIDECGISEHKLKSPALYYDSAYVAAGICAATQNERILKNKKFDVDPKSICTRFNIEQDEKNRFSFATRFNLPKNGSRNAAISQLIDEARLGFCFESTPTNYDGAMISKAYVYLARTCSGKEIYRTLTKTAVEIYIRLSLGSVKTEKRNMEVCTALQRKLKDDSVDSSRYINRLIYAENNEKIELVKADGKCIINVTLAGTPNTVEPEIREDEAENNE